MHRDVRLPHSDAGISDDHMRPLFMGEVNTRVVYPSGARALTKLGKCRESETTTNTGVLICHSTVITCGNLIGMVIGKQITYFVMHTDSTKGCPTLVK
jgi:hypothetical protein